jgi:antirestriction protein ArdC
LALLGPIQLCGLRRQQTHNQLLIANQCPEAARVAGSRAWLALGYGVRRGERGIQIWAPCPPSKRQLAEWRQSGANPNEKPPTYFKLVAVFDRSQVDPLPSSSAVRSSSSPLQNQLTASPGRLLKAAALRSF